jgi:hypothetical protein
MKLIKLSETHYIIVDNSEIKEGDWCLDMNRIVFKHENHFPISIGQRKITHSTQPLENINFVDEAEGKIIPKIKPLSLSEVEEAIDGYSVEKMAEKEFNIKHQSDETRWKKALWKDGFNAHKELVKDKLLITDKDFFNFLYFAKTHSQYSDEAIVKEFIDKFLKKKTEWDVEFDEQGKLKLI